jgi:RHS repeat-associated protein
VVLNHLVYDSFGTIVSETAPIVNYRFDYTGKTTDAETSLRYHLGRYVDAHTGTFINEDLLGFASGDLNLYRYVANNPINYIDPTGNKGAPVLDPLTQPTKVNPITQPGAFPGETVIVPPPTTPPNPSGWRFFPLGGLLVTATVAFWAAMQQPTAKSSINEVRQELLEPPSEPVPDPNDCQEEKPCRYTIDEHHLFYPDRRFGGVTGFHSTFRADRVATNENGIYYWITKLDWDAEFEPFWAKWGIPDTTLIKEEGSSFFPIDMEDDEVLKAIGKAYIEDGCRANGAWSETTTNPITNNEDLGIQGTVLNHHILTAFPSNVSN